MSTLLNSTNLLKLAFGAIPPRKILWRKFKEIAIDASGEEVVTYETPEEITAHVQSVEQSNYKNLGLDFTKQYCYVYSLSHIRDNSSQEMPDQLLFDGGTWTVVGLNDWYIYNGWTSVLVVLDKREGLL